MLFYGGERQQKVYKTDYNNLKEQWKYSATKVIKVMEVRILSKEKTGLQYIYGRSGKTLNMMTLQGINSFLNCTQRQ